MRDFKVGDIIECVSDVKWNYNGVKEGEIYTVEDYQSLGDGFFRIKIKGYWFSPLKFKLRLDLIREEKLNQILNF